MKDFVVGEPYDPTVQTWEPGSFFDVSGEDISLEIFWDSPSDEEVRRVAEGPGRFGLWYSVEGDVYFLYQFGESPWSDTVFSIMQLPAAMRVKPPRVYGKDQLNMTVTLVDSSIGVVLAHRVCALSPGFTRKLCASVARQYSDRYQSAWSESAFHSRCKEMYREFPEPADMTLAMGYATCSVQSPAQYRELLKKSYEDFE